MSRWTVSWFIEFAISGTLALAFGLISLTMAVWIGRVAHVLDRVFISLSAAGSLTWDTETVRPFYWWAWAPLARLSIRLLRPATG